LSHFLLGGRYGGYNAPTTSRWRRCETDAVSQEEFE
jgi:hypothetical protein